MHIAIVFAASQLTDKDEQLVRAVAALPRVETVTLFAVGEERSFVAGLEKLRATVERGVVRASNPVCDIRSLAAHNVLIGADEVNGVFPTLGAVAGRSVNQSQVSVASRGVNYSTAAVAPGEGIHSLNAVADRIVNLSGVALLMPETNATEVLELWFDGTRAKSLGIARATNKPPHDIVVSVWRHGDLQPAVVERSVLTLTPGTPAGDRRNAASRAIALILRALAQPAIARGDQWNASPRSRSLIGAAAGAAAAIAGTVIDAVLRRTTRPLARNDAWEIQYRTDPTSFVANTTSFNSIGFKRYRSDYQRFVADPIVIEHDGIHALFFEEYPHTTRVGFISCATLQHDGTLSDSKPVVKQPYHLSYPFVFKHSDTVFMIPESSANKSVDLYRCTSFPYEWEFQQTLLSDISLTDATVHWDGQRWWLFATAGEFGAYSWDELHLYMADSPTGPWVAHPRNPVKCDPRSARPAGQLFQRDGCWLRPTQDCAKTYGGGINLCEIRTLSPTDFDEVEVDSLSPRQIDGMEGLHTLSATSRLEVIDVRPKLRWRWQR